MLKMFADFTLNINIKEHTITVYDLATEICIKMRTQEKWRLKTHQMKHNENTVGIVTFEKKKIHSKFNVKFVIVSSK